MKKLPASDAKKFGVFYTPEVLARAMARSAIDSYTLKHNDLSKIRILDPSCGDGRFLAAALDELSERLSAVHPELPPEELRRRICENNLFGIDRDRNALEQLRKKLPVYHLQCADALFEVEIKPEYDIVLANPPYISFGLRNTGKLSPELAARCRERFPDSAEYKISTYALFMELGVRMLRPGGIFSYLVPDSFLLGRFFSKLRNFLLAETSLRKIYLIREKIFPAVPGSCVILEAMREKAPLFQKVQCAELSGTGKLTGPAYSVLQNEFSANDLKRFIIFFDETSHRRIRELEAAKKCVLGDVLELASGLIARRGQRSIEHHGDAPPGASWRRGILSGSAVVPGKPVRWEGDWLNTAPEVIKSGLGKVDYASEKLFFRQTGDRIVCAVDRLGLYALNNVHVGVPKNKRCNLDRLAEYLNGEEVRFFYQNTTLEKGRPLAQIDIEFLRKIPLSEKVTDEIFSLNSRSDGKVTEK